MKGLDKSLERADSQLDEYDVGEVVGFFSRTSRDTSSGATEKKLRILTDCCLAMLLTFHVTSCLPQTTR